MRTPYREKIKLLIHNLSLTSNLLWLGLFYYLLLLPPPTSASIVPRTAASPLSFLPPMLFFISDFYVAYMSCRSIYYTKDIISIIYETDSLRILENQR